MPKTKDRVWHAADTARPFVDRALHDEDLRDSLKQAVVAARSVYEDLAGPRGVTAIAHRLATDDDVQQNLRLAVEELRRAAKRVQAQETHKARNTVLLLTGMVIGVLYNPWTGTETRHWLKQQLLGEDEFGYTETGDNSGTGTPAPAES
jgi:hypothetical protein